ncbi:hypothetical protein C5Y96_08175 [Blastopirellula marina]|uniref:Uncharacterized protein n=1 Tax=Blastopirellula marina TaxID=124 RepID=A0A2S8FTX5_9BACT|nr:hypothetical protein C5Y96_08175 [Blastopirellula marina]RCS53203.1 hypothetical protein DTL36_08185 [Bremerella cremea]
MVEIIDADGLWYVTESNARYKCLPYEACFSVPAMYTFLARGEVQVYDEAMGTVGEFEKLDGEVAVYRVPLAEKDRGMLYAVYEQMLNAMAIAPEPNPELEEKLKGYRDFLDNGTQVRINTRTGVIEQAGAMKNIFRVKSFQKLRVVSPKTFDVSGTTWEDRTGRLLGEDDDLSEVILIQHNPATEPGSEGGDKETVMLNRKTGVMRRVPFAHGAIISASLSADHQYCFLTGLLPYEGRIGVFAIDLETQEHFRLGSDAILRGMNLVAEVSPDDSFVAVLQIDYEAGPLKFGLHLIDVETGDSMKIGESQDMTDLDWLPDSSGLVFTLREHDWQLDKSTSFVCRMNLDGEVTRLCRGQQPQLLAASGRILFKGDEDLWYTCDLEGKDHQKVGDGLAKFGAPSADNEGKQVLMMKSGGPKGSRPYVVDVETGDARPVEVGSGVWARPRW